MLAAKTNSNTKLQILTRTALAAAVVFVLTFFLKIPSFTGYVHAGDAAVMLSALILPLPYSLVAAAVGAALADLCGGYVIWIPFTLIIKALMTLPFAFGTRRLLCVRNIVAFPIAIAINVIGYYLSSALIYHSFVSPLSEIPGNIAQSAVGAVICIVVCVFLDVKPRVRSFICLRKAEKENEADK
ncbi:MAG: ECF transporter S component [Eubacteriales bacterium]